MRKHETRLYNIFLPLWMILAIPSWLWLGVIPVNFGIDFLVTYLCTKDIEEHGKFCLRHVWKICLAGFAADLLGCLVMLGLSLIGGTHEGFVLDVFGGVMMNPFSHPLALIITLAVIALVALLIFVLDRWILKKADLTAEKAKYVALRLAIFTAPYLFLFPSDIMYKNAI